MKHLKKAIFILALFLISLTVLAYAFNVDYLIKAIRTIYVKGHQTAFLEDYKEFDNGTIAKSDVAQPWAIHKNYNKIKAAPALEEIHKKLGTVAFLIIKNDKLFELILFNFL